MRDELPLVVAATAAELARALSRTRAVVDSAVLGIGPERARRSLGDRFARARASVVIEVGVAGGLDLRLDAGRVVVADSLRRISPDSPPSEPVALDPALAAAAVNALSRDGLAAELGPVLESPRVIATSAEKRALHEATGALAVDMESLAIHEAAHDIPHLVVRVILDPADQDLVVPQRIVGPTGRVRPGAVAAFALAHPRRFLGFVWSTRRLPRVFAALARATAAILDARVWQP